MFNLSQEVAAHRWGCEDMLDAERTANGINKVQHPAGASCATAMWWQRSLPERHEIIPLFHFSGQMDVAQLTDSDYNEIGLLVCWVVAVKRTFVVCIPHGKQKRGRRRTYVRYGN